MSKRRINISINKELSIIAKMEATRRGMNFSELIEELFIKNIQSQKIIDSVKKAQNNVL